MTSDMLVGALAGFGWGVLAGAVLVTVMDRRRRVWRAGAHRRRDEG